MTGSSNRTKLPAGDQEGAEGCKAVLQGHTPQALPSWDAICMPSVDTWRLSPQQTESQH